MLLQSLRATPLDQHGGEFRMGHDGDGHANGAAAHQLLQQYRGKPKILPTTTVFGRQPHTQVTQFGQLLKQRSRYFTVALPLPRVGPDLTIHEFGNGATQYFKLLGRWQFHVTVSMLWCVSLRRIYFR